MKNPFLLVNENLSAFAENGAFFYLSLIAFAVEFLFGALYLLLLSTQKNLKNKRVNGVYYFYQTLFFIDLWLCFSESVYGGKFITATPVAMLFALAKFVVLIALYGLICAHKAILLLREKDKNKAKLNVLQGEILVANEKNKNAKNQEEELKNFPISLNSLDKIIKVHNENELADVNVAYIRALIENLLTKNLTDVCQQI